MDKNNNNSSLKKENSIGRNNINKIAQKTFSGDNFNRKKNVSNSIDNNMKNNKINGIPTGYKLKKSATNIGNKVNNEKSIPSQSKKNKLIKISEYKIEPSIQSKDENKCMINNSKDILNRLKNQSSFLKSSINKQNNNNNKNKSMNNYQLENKENIQINKHLENEKSHNIIENLIGKHENFGISQRKNFYADKNKFNKNSYFNKEKHNNSNNLIKNRESDIFYQIKNLKSFHPSKYKNNKSIKKSIEQKENSQNEFNNKKSNNIEDNNNNNQSQKKSQYKENNDAKNYIEKDGQINNEENINDDQKNKNQKSKMNDKSESKEGNKNDKKKDDNEDIIKDEEEKDKLEIKNKKENNNVHSNNNIEEKVKNSDNINPKKNDNLTISKELVFYFDTTHINDAQIPKDYINIIYYNLLVEENQELNPKPVHTYMKSQKEINDQMRSILVDWIIDVHHKFGFTDETLFMTIIIIDRYCSSEQISRIKYQCLGITALMIACKHEEINVPKVEDFIYITDNAYTKEEVFKMENDVLSKLKFELLYPSPIKFYEYLSLNFNFTKKYHMLGKYLMETFLLDLKWLKYKPSIISCACTYIVMKFFKMDNYRQSYEKKFYLLDENVNTIPYGLGVKDCAQDICIYVDNINNTNLLSCQKKYTKPEFESVAKLLNNNDKA